MYCTSIYEQQISVNTQLWVSRCYLGYSLEECAREIFYSCSIYRKRSCEDYFVAASLSNVCLIKEIQVIFFFMAFGFSTNYTCTHFRAFDIAYPGFQSVVL